MSGWACSVPARRDTYSLTFSSAATVSPILTPLAEVSQIALFISSSLAITGGGTALTVQVCNASSGETGGTAFYNFVTGNAPLLGLASTQGLQVQVGTCVVFENFGFQQLRLTSTGGVTDGGTHYAVVTKTSDLFIQL